MNKRYIIITSLVACIFMYAVEQFIGVNYLVQTIIKILIFTIIPYIYIKNIKKEKISTSLNLNNTKINNLKLGILLGIISFSIIMIAYYFLKSAIDFETIISELQEKLKVSPANFIMVGLYITLGNSFLEEYFFRGFIFLNLYELGHKKTAYLYSSMLFSLYHIGIFKSWFSIELTILALVGLICAGLLFNIIDTKSQNFINSFIVHIFADSAIILIGMKLFGLF